MSSPSFYGVAQIGRFTPRSLRPSSPCWGGSNSIGLAMKATRVVFTRFAGWFKYEKAVFTLFLRFSSSFGGVAQIRCKHPAGHHWLYSPSFRGVVQMEAGRALSHGAFSPPFCGVAQIRCSDHQCRSLPHPHFVGWLKSIGIGERYGRRSPSFCGVAQMVSS